MYKNKALKRSYVFAYVMVVFGLMIPVLLSIKVGAALAIIMLILVLADLAALIVSEVYYPKDDKIYFITGASAIGGFNLITLIGLIMEIVYSAQGKSATYAWVMLVITLCACALLDVFFILDYFKKKKEIEKKAK